MCFVLTASVLAAATASAAHAGTALPFCGGEPGPLPETCTLEVANAGFEGESLMPWLVAGPHEMPTISRTHGNGELLLRHPRGAALQFVPLPAHAYQSSVSTEYLPSLTARTNAGVAMLRVSAAVIGKEFQPVTLFSRDYPVSTTPTQLRGAFIGAPLVLPPQLLFRLERSDENGDVSVFVDDVRIDQRR
jgi:hypothetical protein